MAFLVSSCVSDGGTTPDDKDKPGSETRIPDDKVPVSSQYHKNPDLPWIWNCLPRDGNPVYFSTSGLRKKRDDEKTWALQSAAIQAAQFDHISGSREYLMQSTSISFGRMENSEVFFNHDTARLLFEQLEVIEEYSDDQGTYLLSKIPSQTIDVPYFIKYRKGEPTWISEVPVIPGYIVAVGSVKMHRTFTDSLAAADRAAFLEMLNIIFGHVDSQRDEVTQSSETQEDSASITTTKITASGNIKGFLIIARWRDEKHNYYSLAVCPVSQ
jgi:hypothetical protein